LRRKNIQEYLRPVSVTKPDRLTWFKFACAVQQEIFVWGEGDFELKMVL
jgi:hypothetical protein